MSDPTWSFNGSAIARTSAAGAVWTVASWRVGPAVLAERDHKPDQLNDALIDQGVPHLDPVREVEIDVEADVSGITGSDIDAKIADGWQELTEAFDPAAGIVKLQSARLNASGATVTRYLLIELTDVPSLTHRTAKPANLDDSGGYAGEGGYIVYKLRGRTVFPYWIGASLLTVDSGAAAAELAISGSTDTVTIDNDSRRWVGVRLRIKAGSVSGSVTSIQFDNGANDDQLIWTNSGGFVAGDYIDWRATDPRKIDRMDSDNRFGGTSTKMRLEQGSNTITSTRLAGSGTLTVELLYPELHLTN